jgi:hypothetical protein
MWNQAITGGSPFTVEKNNPVAAGLIHGKAETTFTFGAMSKLSFPASTSFNDLPLSKLDETRFSVYVIDRDWNYLYVNRFVKENLGERGAGLAGKNMWRTFPELGMDPMFKTLRERSEQGLDSDLTTVSPLTFQRINVTGQVLQDCYLFTASIVPRREDVISDLKSELRKEKKEFRK